MTSTHTTKNDHNTAQSQTQTSLFRPSLTYQITGSAAFHRIAPLLSSLDSITVTPRQVDDITSSDEPTVPQLLWENAPRKETRLYRDDVKCYSHLPNGTAVLDSKWALARLFDSRLHADQPNDNDNNGILATLETHCFRGLTGFDKFCKRVSMQFESEMSRNCLDVPLETDDFPDLWHQQFMTIPSSFPKAPANLWVVKDASSNGAGGVWVVGPENASDMMDATSSPLVKDHRYVAQRYVWPPVLYGGRKCHVRVYGLVTSDEQAFIHKRAFLHVANDPFQLHPSKGSSAMFHPSVHITNCCANSHDPRKFSGEICADLEAESFSTEKHGQTVVPLQPFYPSIATSLATLARRALPFLRGGAANNGFEYLGMDFILSYSEDGKPIAYLLEVNAPPSQETATGLDHAEDLHNEVIRDLLTLWVIPKVSNGCIAPKPGGWKCVHRSLIHEPTSAYLAPSKAVILNKIHWAIFEQKASKMDEGQTLAVLPSNATLPNANKSLTTACIGSYARQQFPFFCVACRSTIVRSFGGSKPLSSIWETRIFFENAGGAQVPQRVVQAMIRSLAFRHRACVGSKSKIDAKNILATVLGAAPDEYRLFFGPNASTLFSTLASEYIRLGLIGPLDEIIISSENHVALSEPWMRAANSVGATIKWWIPTQKVNSPSGLVYSHDLERLLTHRTRIVAITHASNILGQVRDLRAIACLVKERTNCYGHVVADGVAAAPHLFPSVSKLGVDWYGVSCHKLFGPHLGALCGRLSIVQEMQTLQTNETNLELNSVGKFLEIGTVSYEACEGVRGLGEYLRDLASCKPELDHAKDIPAQKLVLENMQEYGNLQNSQSAGDATECAPHCSCNSGHILYKDEISVDEVVEAYRRIKSVEVALVDALLQGLKRSSKVRIIESNDLPQMMRLPVISFVHQDISSSKIVQICQQAGVACRHGTFLSCHLLARSFGYDANEGVVRLSLLHYNSLAEIECLFQVLDSVPGWL